MTAIAACCVAGLMASDSQWSDEAQKGIRRKVFRIRGALIGFAGDLDKIADALRWFRAEMSGKAPTGDVAAIILHGHGIEVWTPTDGLLKMDERQFAIGTGGPCARAAMMAGADPAKAVRIATQIDAGSGGRVRAYRLEP